MPITITRNSFTEEVHPWNFHIPANADKILIGTFPSEEKNRKQSFFYCSHTNRFWDVLAEVAGIKVSELSADSAIGDRKNILSLLNMGLADMGKVVLRQRDSSKDHSLFPVEFTDIIQLLHDHSNIRIIIVSGGKNGNSSLSWFGTYCSLNNVYINMKQLQEDKKTNINIADRQISVIRGYSTSGNSRVTREKIIETFKNIL